LKENIMSKLIVFVAAAFGLDAIPVFAAGNESLSTSSGRAWLTTGRPDRVVAGVPLFPVVLAAIAQATVVGLRSAPHVRLRVTPGG
jgi:hypothetical protein